MITKIVAYSIGSIVSLLAVGTIFSNDIARYDDQRAVIIFGIILGLLTAFVKPVLSVLTLPITCSDVRRLRARTQCGTVWVGCPVDE